MAGWGKRSWGRASSRLRMHGGDNRPDVVAIGVLNEERERQANPSR